VRSIDRYYPRPPQGGEALRRRYALAPGNAEDSMMGTMIVPMKRREHVRGVHGALAWAAVAGGIAAVTAVACQDRAGDPCLNDLASCASGATGGGSSTASTGGHDGGTGGTGGTGGQPNCDPTAGAIATSCSGVFVSSSGGDDGNAGTQAAPLKSLAAAVMKAGAGRVYACGEVFTEAVQVTAATTLYGALDCAKGWAYDATKQTVLTAAAGAIPLTLTSTVVGAEVLDFKIVAADNTKTPGGSSIAVVVDQASATLTRCDLVAGAASDGSAGMSGGAQAMAANGGMMGGNAGPNGMGGTAGGDGGSNTVCGLQGGNGGGGGTAPNGNGGDGVPGDTTTGGMKGSGDTGSGCTPGGQGSNGMPGVAGPVTPGVGALDTSGYHGVDGQPGMDGTNGASGGGGGGSMAMPPGWISAMGMVMAHL
jgi:hypothetical protein